MTFEERAKEYCHREKVENVDCLHAYIFGAVEQQAIDAEIYTEEMRKLNEEWKENLEIQRKMLIDNAVKWVDENVGTLTAIALRKAMGE